VLGPPAVALVCGVGAPILHATWQLMALPWWIAHGIAVLGVLLAYTTALQRRAGLGRYLAIAAWTTVVVWCWTVWIAGASIDAYRALTIALAASWPIWCWWCWWRGRFVTVQDGENHWSIVHGPSLRLPTAARAARKIRRWRNRREHRRAQAHREHERLSGKA